MSIPEAPKVDEKSQDYLHGYSIEEQNRLYRQARFLEGSIYPGIDFSAQKHILEVGSGVGAQTEILLERFPHLKISCVDRSSEQVARAREHLASAIEAGRVSLNIADAGKLPFPDGQFDGAFICWFLEHVQDPLSVLREVRRVLKPGSLIYCNEVLNSSLFLHPYSPQTLKYWFVYNDHQWNLRGDPFIGAKLANFLIDAGFEKIETKAIVDHYDNRMPKRRAQFIDYWIRLLQSGAPALLEAGKVDQTMVDGMAAELETLKHDPDSVFYYNWIQAKGQAF